MDNSPLDSTAFQAAREAYDRTPYPGLAQQHTHPDNLATLALLHGMRPAPPTRCRVLELGCSDGGNLVPMAFELPDSRFTGIDLSPRQIDSGRGTAAALGLNNLDLQALSLTEVDRSFGRFDYIIAHGVFSWVPDWVQDHVLRICKENLAPQGVAYISYNTLPGWHFRGMVREMMLYHAAGETDPLRRGEKALELMGFLEQASAREQGAYALALRQVKQHLAQYDEHSHYLIHEYLEDHNQPLYFHQFVSRIAGHGLQYLADASGRGAGVANLRPEIGEAIRGFAQDRLAQEQYVDFIANRTFRCSLLCHRELSLTLDLEVERLRGLHAGTAARPENKEIDLSSQASEVFINADDEAFQVSQPLVKAVLALLGRAWPGTLAVTELLEAVRLCFEPAEVREADLAQVLLSFYFAGIVDLHWRAAACTARISSYPRASLLARRQLALGQRVDNCRHRTLKLDEPVMQLVLAHLDGRHDRAALIRVLEREVRAGTLKLSYEDKPIQDRDQLTAVLERLVDGQLARLAQNALLVG